jgi:AcrB/AcrD/AcrF family
VFQQLRNAGYTVIDAVKEGALQRLRTVLMMAMLAALGLLPMGLSHDTGSETQHPLSRRGDSVFGHRHAANAGGVAGFVCGLVFQQAPACTQRSLSGINPNAKATARKCCGFLLGQAQDTLARV